MSAARDGQVPLSYSRARSLSLFGEISPRMDGLLRGEGRRGTMVLRRFRAGEVICRQGDPGWTAFYLIRNEDLIELRERGGADASELAALRAEQTNPGAGDERAEVLVEAGGAAPAAPVGALDRLLALVGKKGPASGTRAPRRIATLHEGELFGELSCLHHAPRSATVRALRDCHAVEIPGHVLRFMLDSREFRAELDATWRRRALGDLLRGLPIFARATDEAIERLRQRAELVSRAPGDVVFEEGAPSDSLYVIRAGTIRIARRADGERVLGYRSRGEVIGAHGLVTGEPRGATCSAWQHPRGGASPSRRPPPEMRVELVRIDRALFEELCARCPAVRDDVARLAPREAPAEAPAGRRQASRIDELGLAQGRRLMLIDRDRCTGCDECVRACADVHEDRRPRLARGGPHVDRHEVPTTCRACADPVCLVGCPVGAIRQGAASQIVIDPSCIGCGLCAAQCPYGAIELHVTGRGDEERDLAVVCDQCAGVRGGPRCVTACAHDAALRLDARAALSNIAPAPERR